jgi:hypothetical protein
VVRQRKISSASQIRLVWTSALTRQVLDARLWVIRPIRKRRAIHDCAKKFPLLGSEARGALGEWNDVTRTSKVDAEDATVRGTILAFWWWAVTAGSCQCLWDGES